MDVVVERIVGRWEQSNAYLLGEPGGPCVVIDPGAAARETTAAAARHGMEPAAVLITHHHWDHVAGLEDLLDRVGPIDVLLHPAEREPAAALVAGITDVVEPGDLLRIGDLQLRALGTPGHTAGSLSFHGHGQVFSGDTLYRDAVGGLDGPGATDEDDLRTSVLDVLLELPDETQLRPGHGEPSTIGRERRRNPAILAWAA